MIFVVNDKGEVVNVEAMRGVNAVLDAEAVRVVRLMKKWKPGMQHDLPVNVRMVLPIKFQLER
jgi:protein TonB